MPYTNIEARRKNQREWIAKKRARAKSGYWKCPECGAETDGTYPVDHTTECNYCKNRIEKMLKEQKEGEQK